MSISRGHSYPAGMSRTCFPPASEQLSQLGYLYNWLYCFSPTQLPIWSNLSLCAVGLRGKLSKLPSGQVDLSKGPDCGARVRRQHGDSIPKHAEQEIKLVTCCSSANLEQIWPGGCTSCSFGCVWCPAMLRGSGSQRLKLCCMNGAHLHQFILMELMGSAPQEGFCRCRAQIAKDHLGVTVDASSAVVMSPGFVCASAYLGWNDNSKAKGDATPRNLKCHLTWTCLLLKQAMHDLFEKVLAGKPMCCTACREM